MDGSLIDTRTTNINTGSANTAIWLGDKNGNTNEFGNAWLDNFRIWQNYADDDQFAVFDMNNL